MLSKEGLMTGVICEIHCIFYVLLNFIVASIDLCLPSHGGQLSDFCEQV